MSLFFIWLFSSSNLFPYVNCSGHEVFCPAFFRKHLLPAPRVNGLSAQRPQDPQGLRIRYTGDHKRTTVRQYVRSGRKGGREDMDTVSTCHAGGLGREQHGTVTCYLVNSHLATQTPKPWLINTVAIAS